MFSLVFTILHVCFWVIYCEVCNLDLVSAPGVQSAEHNHHQLLRPLSEGRVHCRPGDDQTRGRVRLRLQQRPSSAHLQQHELRLLPQPVPGAPQSDRGPGAETWSSNHTQSTSQPLLLLWFIFIISMQEGILKSITICTDIGIHLHLFIYLNCFTAHTVNTQHISWLHFCFSEKLHFWICSLWTPMCG